MNIVDNVNWDFDICVVDEVNRGGDEWIYSYGGGKVLSGDGKGVELDVCDEFGHGYKSIVDKCVKGT